MINPSEVFSRTSIQIYLFFVKRIEEDNIDYATLNEIVKGTKMSYPSINETCKELKRNNILIQRPAGIFLYKANPIFLANFKTLLESPLESQKEDYRNWQT